MRVNPFVCRFVLLIYNICHMKTYRIIIPALLGALFLTTSCIGWEGTVSEGVTIPVGGYDGYYNPWWGVGSNIYYPIGPGTPPPPPPAYIPSVPNPPRPSAPSAPTPPSNTRPGNQVRPGTNNSPSYTPVGPANRPGNNGLPSVSSTPGNASSTTSHRGR